MEAGHQSWRLTATRYHIKPTLYAYSPRIFICKTGYLGEMKWTQWVRVTQAQRVSRDCLVGFWFRVSRRDLDGSVLSISNTELQSPMIWWISSFMYERHTSYLSNRPQVSLVYRLINHLGCWKNTRRILKSLTSGSWFTNSSSVLPTSCVVHQPMNHRNLWSIA